MKTININASKKYDVCIGSDIIAADSFLLENIQDKSVMIVSDDNVFTLYGERIQKLLEKNGNRVLTFVFPHGEQSKTLQVYSELQEEMCKGRMTRSDVIVALGGGVTGDLAGFAAATYQRGIGFIQLPTSLLAAVDSSVGGKTGVDLTAGKNQVGAFYQPLHVLCDINMLDTLPEDEYRNGCAEIIKYAMIGNARLFDHLGEVSVRDDYENVISTCVAMKRDFVEKDEFDTGARMLLNFGHTIGHAVESCSGYSIPHGQAVAIGMAIITKASASMGYCDIDVYEKLLALLNKYELPVASAYMADELAAVIMNDKKGKGNEITLVIPEKIGCCVLKTVKKDEIHAWLKAGGC